MWRCGPGEHESNHEIPDVTGDGGHENAEDTDRKLFCARAVRPGIVLRRFTGKNVIFAYLSASLNNRRSYVGKGFFCSALLSGAQHGAAFGVSPPVSRRI